MRGAPVCGSRHAAAKGSAASCSIVARSRRGSCTTTSCCSPVGSCQVEAFSPASAGRSVREIAPTPTPRSLARSRRTSIRTSGRSSSRPIPLRWHGRAPRDLEHFVRDAAQLVDLVALDVDLQRLYRTAEAAGLEHRNRGARQHRDLAPEDARHFLLAAVPRLLGCQLDVDLGFVHLGVEAAGDGFVGVRDLRIGAQERRDFADTVAGVIQRRAHGCLDQDCQLLVVGDRHEAAADERKEHHRRHERCAAMPSVAMRCASAQPTRRR
jgi:hypothetical protein